MKSIVQKSISLLVIAMHILSFKTANACTALAFNRNAESSIIFAKNFDFSSGSVSIVENPPGLQHGGNGSPEWTSKYRTIMMNLMWHGQTPLPMGGMNEAGLALETLYNFDTDYPVVPGREQIDNLAWLQYQLDQYSSVDEVEKNITQFTINSSYKRHYFGCDPKDCFVLDFRDGKAHFYRRSNLPVKALANDLYALNLKSLIATGGEAVQGLTSPADGIDLAQLPSLKMPDHLGPDYAANSQGRFNIVAIGVLSLPAMDTNEEAVTYAAGLLKMAEQSRTQWNFIYNLDQRKLYFRLKGEVEFRVFAFAATPVTTSTQLFQR